LPTERGIAVSYETVRRWVKHFGSMITAHLRKRRPKPHAIWHLNEVYLQIDGGWFIYGAPSTPSEVLEDTGPIRARQARALKLMRKLLKNYASAPEP
jgi:putative transposase